MNCKSFKKVLLEYVEGSLDSQAKAAADDHLARCAECRRAVRAEQEATRRLTDLLQKRAQTVALDPAARHRLVQALHHRPTQVTMATAVVAWWRRRPAFLLAGATALAAIAVFLVISFRPIADKTSDLPRRIAHEQHPVEIHVSYFVQTYTFKQEGDRVVDTLVPQTNYVNVMLWTDVSQTANPKQPKIDL